MCCKGKFGKTLALLLIGFCAIGFIFSGAEMSVNPREAQFIPRCENLPNHHSFIGVECVSSNNQQTSDPLAYLFQIIFILFFISPPLIVILLFLIWRELKERNRMK
jgi:hypothetical protein